MFVCKSYAYEIGHANDAILHTKKPCAWTPVSRAADFPGLRGQTLDFPDFPGLRLKFRRSKFRNSKVHGHASRFAC
jgi:hypothetical protein